MYVPDPYALHDQAAIAGLLRRHSFALLVTAADGAPQASHLARANPQAAELERLATAAALRESGGPEAREVAALMESPALDP